VLQCFGVCCSVLQCVETYKDKTYYGFSPFYMASYCSRVLQCVAVCCCVLQCVAVRCSVLQCVAVCCDLSRYGILLLQCVAVFCSVLQCVAVCCSVLQCAAVCCSVLRAIKVRYAMHLGLQHTATWTATHCNMLCILAMLHGT